MIPIFCLIGAVCLFYLLLVFLTSPSSKIHTDLEWIRGKMIAHRGLHNKEKGIPENSLPSFEAAADSGFPIEIDLHLTKDQQVVVFHDSECKRMCRFEGKIEEMTLDQIKALRLLDTENEIPTLAECLERVDGRVPLLIEFKVSGNNTKMLCTQAEKILSQYCGPYLIQSFHPQVLNWYRKNNKKICRGQLAADFKHDSFAKTMLGNMLLNFIGRPHFVSYKHSDCKNRMFRFAVWQGAFPVGWTFQNPDELRAHKTNFKCWIFEHFTPDI